MKFFFRFLKERFTDILNFMGVFRRRAIFLVPTNVYVTDKDLDNLQILCDLNCPKSSDYCSLLTKVLSTVFHLNIPTTNTLEFNKYNLVRIVGIFGDWSDTDLLIIKINGDMFTFLPDGVDIKDNSFYPDTVSRLGHIFFRYVPGQRATECTIVTFDSSSEEHILETTKEMSEETILRYGIKFHTEKEVVDQILAWRKTS